MKTSILDQFAADALRAPVAVTGGGGKVIKGSGKSGGGSRKSHGSKLSHRSHGSNSGGSRSGGSKSRGPGKPPRKCI